MLRAAIYGYGNIGRFVLEALLASPDFEIAGIVSRHLTECELNGVKVANRIDELGKVDVAILCAPSRSVPDLAAELLKKGNHDKMKLKILFGLTVLFAILVVLSNVFGW